VCVCVCVSVCLGGWVWVGADGAVVAICCVRMREVVAHGLLSSY
jgi:hypothetical protein